MPKPAFYATAVLMIAIGLVAAYTILNAGNPHSLVRHVFPNPAADVYVALASSFLVFILGFVVFFSQDRSDFLNLLQMNQQRIADLRKAGQSDEQIADSLLDALGSRKGRRHNMARRKLLAYLAEFR